MPLGVVRGAYGVKGWIRIEPYDREASVLQSVRLWWLKRGELVTRLEVSASKKHGSGLIAKCVGCDHPEAADELKGALAAVARKDFPPLEPGQHYWVDLIGVRVLNRSGIELGRVVALQNNGAHDLLEIAGADGEFSVPLVEKYVDAVDIDLIQVDWEPDW